MNKRILTGRLFRDVMWVRGIVSVEPSGKDTMIKGQKHLDIRSRGWT